MNERGEVPGPVAPPLTEEVGTWLDRARGPALVIAPGEATLLAANAAAFSLLGLEHAPPGVIPLDSAMPAIMDLRRAVQKGDGGLATSLPLVFWTSGGIARLPCHVSVRSGADGRALALVEIATAQAQAQATAPAERTAAARDAKGECDAQTIAPATSQAAAQSRNETTKEAAQPDDAQISDVAPLPTGTPSGAAPSDMIPPPPPPVRPAHAAESQEPVGVRDEPAKRARTASARAPRADRPAPSSPEPAQRTTSTQSPPGLAGLPGAGTATSASSAPRSDAETLKAIARQILAGRRKQPAAPEASQPSTAKRPVYGNGAAPASAPAVQTAPHAPSDTSARERVPPMRAADALRAPTSMPAATHSSARDVRRSGSPQSELAAPAQRDERAHSPSADTGPSAQSLKPGSAIDEDRTKNVVDPDAPSGDPSRGGAARRELIRRMAHELKTPISAIASAAEIMKDERLGPIGEARYLRYAQDIHESARHALAVIERLLGQRQTQPGQSEFSFTNVDVNALASGLVSGLETMAKEAGLDLCTALAERLPLVVADATSLRQIVLNLLTNALKFTPRGGHVRLITQMLPEGELEVCVADTGPGMSDADIKRALSGTHNGISPPEGAPQQRPGGGFGIGLPLVQSLAAANGAVLSIASGASGGTRAALVFPPSRLILV